MIMPNQDQGAYALPPLGDNPSTHRQGTSPGSFANKGRVGTPWTFSSPDTPGMPAPHVQPTPRPQPQPRVSQAPPSGATDVPEMEIPTFIRRQMD